MNKKETYNTPDRNDASQRKIKRLYLVTATTAALAFTMAMPVFAANKVPGIRCALCGDCFSARATRQHNDANVLALGALVTGPGLALEIVDIFLNTPFSGEERHCRRVAQLEEP